MSNGLLQPNMEHVMYLGNYTTKRYFKVITKQYNFRYLTTMQLVQFATFFIHATFPLFIECDFPKYYSYVILFHGAMFFALFSNFYIQAVFLFARVRLVRGIDGFVTLEGAGKCCGA